MLDLAGAAEPGPHRGAVVRLEDWPLAPSVRLLREAGDGRLAGPACARASLGERRHRWGRDPRPFLDLLALAGGGDGPAGGRSRGHGASPDAARRRGVGHSVRRAGPLEHERDPDQHGLGRGGADPPPLVVEDADELPALRAVPIEDAVEAVDGRAVRQREPPADPLPPRRLGRVVLPAPRPPRPAPRAPTVHPGTLPPAPPPAPACQRASAPAGDAPMRSGAPARRRATTHAGGRGGAPRVPSRGSVAPGANPPLSQRTKARAWWM